MKKILNLDGSWRLYIAPNREVNLRHFSPTTEQELKGSGFPRISATVPGNFELDMKEAGMLPDPFTGINPLLMQKEENKHLWYAKSFSVSELTEDELSFRFEGIDTFAEIYLNGTQIGTCDNMLVAHEYPANGLKIGKNELLVHILPTAIVARSFEGNAINLGQAYNFDSLHVRKAPYMFGWDIMPRFVSGGIWRSVSLVSKPKNRIDEFYIATRSVDMKKNTARIYFHTHISTNEDFLDDFRMEITGRCGSSEFKKTVRFFSANYRSSLALSNPLLWWPVGVGAQNLYDVEVALYLRDELCDIYRCRFGIRQIHLERTSVIDENGNGKFEFTVNGKKVFILGTNWVPLDAFPSQNEKRLDRALAMVSDIGCNMIRLWGGNIYECDAFYDYCDEHGILLWQDFIMGCGFYPQNDRFANALRTEAITAVKRLRQHPSLALWAGDNECDVFSPVDPNKNILTRKVLPEVLLTYDPYRDYLPSSPYVDEKAYQSRRPISEDHLWGPRNHFKSDYYRNAVCRFASETGFHGCPSPDSLKRYISKDHLWPNMKENNRPDEEWTVHAASMEITNPGPYEYRIGLMNRQVSQLFGPADFNYADHTPRQVFDLVASLFPDSKDPLSDFAKASQIFQAEGFKYMIERFRIRKSTHGGLIWWNLLDGWPQISDAIVDYYFVKKLAYSYIKRSQQPLCLMFDEPCDGRINLVAVNDLPYGDRISYTVKRFSDSVTVAAGEVDIDADGVSVIDSVAITDSEQMPYLIEWSTQNGKTGQNHFITNLKHYNYDAYLDFLEAVGFDRFEGFSEGETK